MKKITIKDQIQEALNQYKKDDNVAKDYFHSMKEISLWLKEQEK